MNGLQIFNNEEFGVVRTVTIDNEPWFVASDICKALEISNVSVAISRLDEDERSKFNLGRQGDQCVSAVTNYMNNAKNPHLDVVLEMIGIVKEGDKE